MEFYLHFNLDMGRSPGFGSNITDFIRPIQTRSRCGSGPLVLNLASYINSPDHSTIGTRSPFDGLSVLVSTRFQVLFHSPPGVLFTFPSQYFSTIGHRVVFRLRGWSPYLPCGFHVPAGTLCTTVPSASLTGLSPSLVGLPIPFCCIPHSFLYPKALLLWFGLFRVRSPLLTESRLISLPLPT